jgi:DNA-binding GntR family transcriptional regulator
MTTNSLSAKGERRRTAKAESGTNLLTAFQEIRELIVHGELYPGSSIVEGDLAKRLDMSRTPIRGALHWLQHEGYVCKNLNKSGMFVAPLTKDDGSELYSIIGRIEATAGRQIAVLSRQKRLAIADELRAISQCLSNMTKASYGGATGEILDLDSSFHRLIVNSGAGPRLLVLHSAIEPQIERYRRLYSDYIIDDLHLSIEEHEKIIGAIAGGNASEMEFALKANWENGCQRLGRVIDMFGDRGNSTAIGTGL